jgi:hypothetical protein
VDTASASSPVLVELSTLDVDDDESLDGEPDDDPLGVIVLEAADGVDEPRVNHPLRAPNPTNALPISKKTTARIDSVRCWFPR